MAKASALAFVSYSRTDFDFAHQLVQDLKAHGASVWLDKMDIIAGERWDSAVEHALTNAPMMLVILSATSVGSTNVMDEVSFALETGKTVIPIISQECAVPFRLRRLQYVDFRTSYSDALSELLRALDPEHERPSPEPAPEPVKTALKPAAPPPRLSTTCSRIRLVMSGSFYIGFDTPISVELDGRQVGMGSWQKGINVMFDADPGVHQLQLTKHSHALYEVTMKVMPSVYVDRANVARQQIHVPPGGSYEIKASLNRFTTFISIDPTLKPIQA